MADPTPTAEERQQEAKRQKEHLQALWRAMTLVEDDPEQQDKYTQLATQYHDLMARIPSTRLELKIGITVPVGKEDYGRQELFEYLQSLYNDDDEFNAVITETPGDANDIPEHILGDYEDDLDEEHQDDQ